MRELEDAKQKAAEAKLELENHREAQPRLEQEVLSLKQEAQSLHASHKAKQAEVRECESNLWALRRDQGHRIEVFHERMPQLLRAIKDEPRFRETPVGPIGNHVRLLKPEWSSILEKSFGAILNSFIVTSVQDQSILSDLMRRVNW